MISSISNNISALKAIGKKLGVSAGNIANAESENFKKSRAVITEGKNNNVEVDINRVETPGYIITGYKNGKAYTKELSNVDLTEEVPQMIISRRSFEANLRAIEIQDETLGSVLNIIG